MCGDVFSAQISVIKKHLIFLLSLGLLASSCYSSKSISLRSQESLDRMNRDVSKRTARIEVADGESFIGKAVQVRRDSTSWRDAKTESTRYSVPTSEIKSISIQKRNTLKGLGRGFLIGVALGASIIQTGLIKFPCFDGCDRLNAAIIGVVLFTPPSTVLGLTVGAATKTTESYNLEEREREP